MLYERYIGAFVQNTLKPLIEDLDKLLGKCENLKLSGLEFENLLYAAFEYELSKTRIWATVYICGFISLLIGLYFLLTYSPTPTP